MGEEPIYVREKYVHRIIYELKHTTDRDRYYHIVMSILRSKKYLLYIKSRLRDVALKLSLFTKRQLRSILEANPKLYVPHCKEELCEGECMTSFVISYCNGHHINWIIDMCLDDYYLNNCTYRKNETFLFIKRALEDNSYTAYLRWKLLEAVKESKVIFTKRQRHIILTSTIV